jgi:superfamily II DNA or RNA helicase
MNRVVCTPVWKQGVDFTRLRWLIRADATANYIFSVQAGGRLSRGSAGKTCAGLIDFIDKFSGMERRSALRIRNYKKVGWDVRRVG